MHLFLWNYVIRKYSLPSGGINNFSARAAIMFLVLSVHIGRKLQLFWVSKYNKFLLFVENCISAGATKFSYAIIFVLFGIFCSN